MNIIKSVEIQPDTPAERIYFLGKTLAGNSVITEISVIHHEGITIVQIFSNNQLYAEYVNVPYAVFYKQHNEEQQK